MEIARIAESLKKGLFDFAINMVAGVLAEYWISALLLSMTVGAALWVWPRLQALTNQWVGDVVSGMRGRVRERKREGLLDKQLSTSQAMANMRIPRRMWLKWACSGMSVICASMYVIQKATGFTIDGILQSGGRNQACIRVVCISETTGQTVDCVIADDTGHFKIEGLPADDYSLFAYRNRRAKDATEWLHMQREVGFLESGHLGKLAFPKKAGQRVTFDPVTFESGNCKLIAEADRNLTQIKLLVGDKKSGVLIIEGLTTDAAGEDGRFDNHALACERCDFVDNFLNAEHWLVIKIPRVPADPRPVKVGQVPRTAGTDPDPERSVRIVMLTLPEDGNAMSTAPEEAAEERAA